MSGKKSKVVSQAKQSVSVKAQNHKASTKDQYEKNKQKRRAKKREKARQTAHRKPARSFYSFSLSQKIIIITNIIIIVFAYIAAANEAIEDAKNNNANLDKQAYIPPTSPTPEITQSHLVKPCDAFWEYFAFSLSAQGNTEKHYVKECIKIIQEPDEKQFQTDVKSYVDALINSKKIKMRNIEARYSAEKREQLIKLAYEKYNRLVREQKIKAIEKQKTSKLNKILEKEPDETVKKILQENPCELTDVTKNKEFITSDDFLKAINNDDIEYFNKLYESDPKELAELILTACKTNNVELFKYLLNNNLVFIKEPDFAYYIYNIAIELEYFSISDLFEKTKGTSKGLKIKQELSEKFIRHAWERQDNKMVLFGVLNVYSDIGKNLFNSTFWLETWEQFKLTNHLSLFKSVLFSNAAAALLPVLVSVYLVYSSLISVLKKFVDFYKYYIGYDKQLAAIGTAYRDKLTKFLSNFYDIRSKQLHFEKDGLKFSITLILRQKKAIKPKEFYSIKEELKKFDGITIDKITLENIVHEKLDKAKLSYTLKNNVLTLQFEKDKKYDFSVLENLKDIINSLVTSSPEYMAKKQAEKKLAIKAEKDRQALNKEEELEKKQNETILVEKQKLKSLRDDISTIRLEALNLLEKTNLTIVNKRIEGTAKVNNLAKDVLQAKTKLENKLNENTKDKLNAIDLIALSQFAISLQEYVDDFQNAFNDFNLATQEEIKQPKKPGALNYKASHNPNETKKSSLSFDRNRNNEADTSQQAISVQVKIPKAESPNNENPITDKDIVIIPNNPSLSPAKTAAVVGFFNKANQKPSSHDDLIKVISEYLKNIKEVLLTLTSGSVLDDITRNSLCHNCLHLLEAWQSISRSSNFPLNIFKDFFAALDDKDLIDLASTIQEMLGNNELDKDKLMDTNLFIKFLNSNRSFNCF